MAFDFKKGFNKFADMNNSINRGVNNMIGKNVFGELKKIEDERVFIPFSSLPPYEVTKPSDWTSLSGQERSFPISGESITVSENLDVCMRYKSLINEEANYYTDQFKYRYNQCVTDYDSFVNYFTDMYMEGLRAVCTKTYGVFLVFGVFDYTEEEFLNAHMKRFHQGYDCFQQISGVEMAKNAKAEALGDIAGNSVRMRGGGFGMKGATKGMINAGIFNAAVSGYGKLVEHQNKMSQEEKASIWQNVQIDIVFTAVLDDFKNVFYSLVQALSDRKLLGNVTTLIMSDTDAMYKNLQNPMFPQDKFLSSMVDLISKNPFQPTLYDMLEQKMGSTEEVKAIRDYFLG